MKFETRKMLALVSVLLTMPAGLALAESFPAKLERLLTEHPLIKMVDADLGTAKAQIDVEKSAYYPKLVLQTSTGKQQIVREQGSSGHFDPSEWSLALNQLVYDFGATSSRVYSVETVAAKEELESGLQRQNLMLAAVEAQLGVIKAEKTLQFAQASEANIKHQARLENTRMEIGRGYATDVLQAKAQLAGAEARRVVAAGQHHEAMNRYIAVFKRGVVDAKALEGLAVPVAMMPRTLQELESLVPAESPDVATARARAQVAMAEKDAQKAKEYMPRIDLQLSRKHYRELDGAVGRRDDTRAEFRFVWNYDMGLKSAYLVDAAELAVTSAKEKAAYIQIQAMEEARNAWKNWQIARERSGHLVNQMNIVNSFLDLARKERELGRRSLLDILNGETALINAQSDATAARIEEVISAYRVLRVSGQLKADLFKRSGVVVNPETLYVAESK